ncbi:MAG: alpha-L-rhamnosidase N-terminal domain-containing protein [Verrucomicrobiales bacterium]|nr:alpha-L-rhamnosidase N-terminal domain-containing protein [Verrucomicrobiales bacterium]
MKSWFTAILLSAGVSFGTDTLVAGEAAPAFVTARWITPPASRPADAAMPVFRKEFQLPSLPRQATLRIIGLGDYDARVNGARLAPTGINQPWSQYEKTLYYRDFDVADQLVPGGNCLTVMLGNSFWNNPNPPAGRYNKDGPQRTAPEPLLLRAELSVVDDSGQVLRIGTDASWRVTAGPVVFSHIFAGEDFDARREMTGADHAGYDASDWQPARVASAPTGALKPQTWPEIHVMQRFMPNAIKPVGDGTFVYSFPQNSSAQLWVKLSGGQAGQRVDFKCGEHRNDLGRLFGAYLVDSHLTTDGNPIEHQWTFFYVGMQFVEVRGAVPEGEPNPTGLPVIEAMELRHVRTALRENGTFRCSEDLYNRTHELVDWAMRSNSSYVLTDCPHREKLGWLECAYLLAPSFLNRYDSTDWFTKIAGDIRDAQESSGRVQTVAPSYPDGRFPGAFTWTVEWGAAAVLLPWDLYEWTGDPEILRDSFDSMQRFTDYIGTEATDGIAPAGLGDWYDYGHGQPPGPSRFTPTTLSATATWALCARACANAAEALNRPAEARAWQQRFAAIRQAFQAHFYDPATHALQNTGSPQCANAMALCADLVPPPARELLVQQIIDDLRRRDWQQTPGDVGHVHFIRALAEAGRSDILHRVYRRTGNGSYGGILAKGLTAMPETWDAMMDGYQSLNHCMLGHIMEWLPEYVAGIRQAPGSVGWRKAIIGPNPGPLTWAEGTLHTQRGTVEARWEKRDGVFRLEVTIPAGMEATALMPSGKSHPLVAGKQALEEPAE